MLPWFLIKYLVVQYLLSRPPSLLIWIHQGAWSELIDEVSYEQIQTFYRFQSWFIPRDAGNSVYSVDRFHGWIGTIPLRKDCKNIFCSHEHFVLLFQGLKLHFDIVEFEIDSKSQPLMHQEIHRTVINCAAWYLLIQSHLHEYHFMIYYQKRIIS